MKHAHTLNAFALAALTLSGIAGAAQINTQAYLTDTHGNVVRTASGLCVHTGHWTPAQAIEECDPVAKKPTPVVAYIAPPAPAAAAPAAQANPVFVPYTLQTEALFDYDKSELREHGKQKIHDEIIDKMKEYTKNDIVMITGYADRIGNEKYNMALSQRRADSVKSYMIAQGIDGNRIETAAKGEADAVVSCDKIKGRANHKNKALISCLQPNRRIVLDLKGQVQK